MTWEVVLAPSALKQLDALPQRDQTAVARGLDRLASDPSNADIRKLGGRRRGEYRLRVGRLRIEFRFNAAANTIEVIDVFSRNRGYR